ncbi:MAG: [protein-PII] uridylyltransferase [Rhodobacteraceae bacterium]|nr:[protein-PII] uridylyltransferase [Paracoccaceae bacterium]
MKTVNKNRLSTKTIPTTNQDKGQLYDKICSTLDPSDSPKQKRQKFVKFLREKIQTNFKKLQSEFENKNISFSSLSNSIVKETDLIISTTFKLATSNLHPTPAPTEAERLSIIAVGGYGREEMAPFSDIDILFLTPYKTTPWTENVIESMLYILWDLKLQIGHATRSIDECILLGGKDFTIRTSLLETRPICGDKNLGDELTTRLWNELFQTSATEFITAKLKERATRHKKHGENRYLLEPNIKEGKGGLRDLQSLFWIAKYIHHVEKPVELIKKGVFNDQEYTKFVNASNFIWQVRCHLHFINNKASEQLNFDSQFEIAKRLSYQDLDGRLAVEHFMQDYFKHATYVGELTRIFLTDLEARHVKKQPNVRQILRSAGKRLTTKLNPLFKLQHNRINVIKGDTFSSHPINIFIIFDEALRTGYLIHPNAMRLITSNIRFIDDSLRQNANAQTIFLNLLLERGNPVRALRRMNELGVLSSFIPEFEPIVAMMQFNVYHHYTVDEHTIQCIENLALLEQNQLVEDLPVASDILKKGLNRRVLYLALLLHDIGKGRTEDHSKLGSKLASKVCIRLKLKKSESDLIEWLVKNHLLMSDVAQKRDLSDPKTVRDFARLVESRTKLKLLTVLTVCDIRGVGPGVWNNWKAQLLRNLYFLTYNALSSGMKDTGHVITEEQSKSNLTQKLSGWEPKEIKKELGRHYKSYWQGLDSSTQLVMAKLLRHISNVEMKIELDLDPEKDATRVCFVMPDHPGIFSRLAGAVALAGANVVDARTYTSSDGFATAVFWLQDKNMSPYKEEQFPKLNSAIKNSLSGSVLSSEAFKIRDKVKKRERDFQVPTEILFDNDGSEIYTIIEVDTRDRPGLLFDLTRTISGANIYIASAVIATYGLQAVDVFYVKDMFGLKLHSQSKQQSLEKKLLQAIEFGTKRASA